MTLTVTGFSGTQYTFEGPYVNTISLEDRSGVYLIVCSSGDKDILIDIGESANVKTRVENHDRKTCWQVNCKNTLRVAVFYTPGVQQSGRMEVEQDIRKNYRFPCGKR